MSTDPLLSAANSAPAASRPTTNAPETAASPAVLLIFLADIAPPRSEAPTLREVEYPATRALTSCPHASVACPPLPEPPPRAPTAHLTPRAQSDSYRSTR